MELKHCSAWSSRREVWEIKKALVGAEASGALFYFISDVTCLFCDDFITCLLNIVILRGIILPPTLLMQECAVFDQQ